MLPISFQSLGYSNKTQNERGFTLIELIVVMALIGIMLSISIPSLRATFFIDPLKSTTRKLIGIVGGVRELAVRYQQPYLLHISQAENRIWYEKDGGEVDKESEKNKRAELLFPETVKISGVWMSGDDELAGDKSVVWISKQGYMNHTIIRIEDDDGNELSVQFYPFLDTAEVSDKAASF